MSCEDFKSLMMGYLDGEIAEEEKRKLERHLKLCPACSGELREFQKLKEVTEGMVLAEPEDRIWEQYWSGIYNRIERSIGWILFSMGSIILLIYGGFKAVEGLITDPTLGVFLKLAVLAVIGGIAILFVSIARERLYFWKRDRYRHVRR